MLGMLSLVHSICSLAWGRRIGTCSFAWGSTDSTLLHWGGICFLTWRLEVSAVLVWGARVYAFVHGDWGHLISYMGAWGICSLACEDLFSSCMGNLLSLHGAESKASAISCMGLGASTLLYRGICYLARGRWRQHKMMLQYITLSWHENNRVFRVLRRNMEWTCHESWQLPDMDRNRLLCTKYIWSSLKCRFLGSPAELTTDQFR